MDENWDEEADHIYFSDYEIFDRYIDEYEKQQTCICKKKLINTLPSQITFVLEYDCREVYRQYRYYSKHFNISHQNMDMRNG